MNKNIIFISGWGVPRFLEKTPLIWNDKLWKDYGRVYLPSKAPRSDAMVKSHLKRLGDFIKAFDKPVVMSQSLGAWWAANLACEAGSNIHKLVLMLPLASCSEFPIFNASQYYYPFNREPVITGPHKVLVCGAKEDFVVPYRDHAYRLCKHFNGIDYPLDGGHFFQKNHTPCLNFIKDWIEID